ncbi:ATP-binding cassette domain-containing protein [bacterium]|nr:ATP-binding cassette domain-containing protein [bacterium]
MEEARRKTSDRAPRGDVRSEILAFDHVSAGYGGSPVLHDITFEVRRGEVAGLVALDGRAKTTLVKCAAGLLSPSEGAVRYDGNDVYRMGFGEDQRFRAKTAVVLEGGALFSNRTIFSNVALPARYHDGGKETDVAPFVHKLLKRVRFNEDPDALPWQISARGRRLAAFARALVREPDLVIVDRFFEALEVHDWKALMELVLELNVQNGVSFLLVGDLQPAIFQVAERVLVLEGGRVVAHDFKRALFKDERIRKAFEESEEAKAGPKGAFAQKKALSQLPRAPALPAPPPRQSLEIASRKAEASDEYEAAALAMSSESDEPAPAAKPPSPARPAAPTTAITPRPAMTTPATPVTPVATPTTPVYESADDERTLTLDQSAADAILRAARERADKRILDEASRVEHGGVETAKFPETPEDSTEPPDSEGAEES